MLVYSTNMDASLFGKYGPLFELSFRNFAFLTYFMKKYAIVEIFTNKKIICETRSINMRI